MYNIIDLVDEKDSPCIVNLGTLLLKCPWHIVFFLLYASEKLQYERLLQHSYHIFSATETEKCLPFWYSVCAHFPSSKKMSDPGSTITYLKTASSVKTQVLVLNCNRVVTVHHWSWFKSKHNSRQKHNC